MDIEQLYERHVDMVYRLCMVYLKNPQDAEDAVQNTFIKLLKQPKNFESVEHEKAWLIVTASNGCKNHLRYWFNSKRSQSEQLDQISVDDNGDKAELLEIIYNLPGNLKNIVYLYYYEGYATDEIARMLKINPSTLRSKLSKARLLLKMEIEGGQNE